MNQFGISRLLRSLLLMALVLPMFAMRADTSSAGEEQIRWRPDFRLQWSDFKGRPDRASNMDALTESGITFSWSCDWRGEFTVEAYAIFIPTGSWVKEPTNYLLAHEQAHFDITEIHARKLRKFFATHPDPCRLGKAGIDKAAQTVIQASYAMQDEYDRATNHGESRSAQREWIAKIALELESLSQYAE
jgi:hypothetical protein